jgi:hypothetical protein
MKKILVMALLAVVVLGFASMSVASEKKATKASMTQHKLVGEVMSIDAPNKSFTVKEAVKSGEAKEITFMMGENAKVMVQSKTGTLNDLKAGDSVTVKYIEKEGKNIAEECHVAKPAA